VVIGSRRGSNRNSRSAGSPAAGRTHDAACVMGHRQIILCFECRCVGLVSGRRDSVRDSSATAPITPEIPNACTAALRGSCGDGMTRTGVPRKRLRRIVSSAVNTKRETSLIGLNSYLNGVLDKRGVLGDRAIHGD